MCHITLPAINLSKKLVERNSCGFQPSPCITCAVLFCFSKPRRNAPYSHRKRWYLTNHSGACSVCHAGSLCVALHAFAYSLHLVFKNSCLSVCFYQFHAWLRIQIKPWYCLGRKCALASLRFKVKVWLGRISNAVWKWESGASATSPD